MAWLSGSWPELASVQAWKTLGNRVVRVVRQPALVVVEKAERTEQGQAPDVEPVPRVCGNSDQIATFAERGQHFALRMQTEQSPPFHHKAQFVFCMGVFREELTSQKRWIGLLRCDPDRIHQGKIPSGLDPFHIVLVGRNNRLGGGTRRQIARGRPLLEVNATIRKLRLNHRRILAHQDWFQRLIVFGRRLFWKDAETTHRLAPGRFDPLTIIEPSTRPGVTVVAVGPGDPDLLTLAAVRAIEQADVIASPTGRFGSVSMAARIAQHWIRPDQESLPLVFPMVEAAEPRRQSWYAAADALAAVVARGQRVVLLCEGDATLFATGSYVVMALQSRHSTCPVRIIPGVTSVSAAAATAGWPLALQQDQLLMMPCPDQEAVLEAALDRARSHSQVLALLKLGHRWRWVKPLLKRRRLLDQSLFAERVGWPEQCVAPASEVAAEPRPYFSLLLIRQSWPAVLP